MILVKKPWKRTFFFLTGIILFMMFLTGVGLLIDDNTINPKPGAIPSATAHSEQWNRTWGGLGLDSGSDIALDPAGNIYAAGFSDSWPDKYASDIWLGKWDAYGNLQWNQTQELITDQYGYGIAVDSSGNAIVVGSSEGIGSINVWLGKWDAAGVDQWTSSWGGPGNESAANVALDSAGKIYVTGYTESWTGVNGSQVWVAKCKLDGGVEWNRTWGGMGADRGSDIALDTAGNIYVAGYTKSWTYFNSVHPWIGKWDSTGTLLWNHTWAASDLEGGYGYGIAVDSSGNAFVAGSVSLGKYKTGIWLAKWNTTGGFQWSTTWGEQGYNSGENVALDAVGNACVTGYTKSNTGSNFDDVWVGKFDTSGVCEWNATAGGLGNDTGYGIALDSIGNIYVAGVTNSSTSVNGNDVWVIKWSEETSPDDPPFDPTIVIIVAIAAAGGVIVAVYFLKIRKGRVKG